MADKLKGAKQNFRLLHEGERDPAQKEGICPQNNDQAQKILKEPRGKTFGGDVHKVSQTSGPRH